MRAVFTDISPNTPAAGGCLNTATPSTACVNGVVAGSSCVVETTAGGSSCILPDTPTIACQEFEGTNWISWTSIKQVDWVIIEPLYSTSGTSELRSSLTTTLESTIQGSRITSFPSSESASVANPNSGILLNTVSQPPNYTLSYSNLGSYIFPTDTNILSRFPLMLLCYQTDDLVGPNEKMLCNVKRLRAEGIDKFSIKFGGFWIINFSRINQPFPIRLRLFSGGVPMISQDSLGNRDWYFPGGTELLSDEVHLVSVPQSANSNANRIDWLRVDFNLSHNYLKLTKL